MAMSLFLCRSLKVRGSLPKLTGTARYLLSKRCYSHRQPDPPLSTIVGDPSLKIFFRYASVRWIWNEEEQIQGKYRQFNITELQKAVEALSSASPCVHMEKLVEGSYNKSFKLTIANKETVVARILNLNAGPAFLTTASKVAMMDFVTTFTIS